VHVLAISGLHVGLLVGSLVLFLGALGLPRRRLRVLAAAVALGYAAWLGWPPPATRAAVLVVLAMVMRWRQRSVRSSGLIGASAVVVMLIDPWAIGRVGAWLSFAAITGVVWATGWISSWQTRWSTLRDAVAASVGATLATAPIAALVLGRVAMIGPLLNLVAIPLVALAVPAAMAAVLLDPFSSGMAAAFAESARWLLAGLTQLARLGSRLPGAATSTTPGVMAALPWLVALMVAWLSTHGRSTPAEGFRRGGWGLCLMLWLPLLTSVWYSPPESGRLSLHFLDVGQGDAIAIESPAGRWLLVDAGPADGRWDAGERVVVPALRRMGVRRIEALLLTHPHRDHVGGALALVEAMPIGIVLDPAEPFGERGYLDLLAELDARRLRWQPVAAGQSWCLDGVSFRILHPGGDWPGRGTDLNEDSVVLEVRFGSFAALLTGDAGLPAEVAYLPQAEAIDLLKVGHHGSRGATGERLLAELAPAVAVISSGRNRYGHPASEVLARLAQYQVETWRTDREGSISVVTDGRSFTVRGGRHVATFDADELNPGDTPCCTQPR
jgi:competence protein ComEC